MNGRHQPIPGRRSRTVRVHARTAHTRSDGQALLELALVSPAALILSLCVVIVAIAAGNQNLLSNGVRDAARAAAVCGGSGRDSATQLPAAGAVAAQTCSWAHLDTYARTRLTELAGADALKAASGGSNCAQLSSGSALVCVYDGSNNAVTVSGNPLDSCEQGYHIDVSAEYLQPVYLPFLGSLISGGKQTMTLKADAVATCEQ